MNPIHQNPLNLELREEKAFSFFRVTRRMEKVVQALHDLDTELAQLTNPAPSQRQRRQELLEEAAEWVWFYVVQREAIGMSPDEDLLRSYGVTDELKQNMGPRLRPA